MRKIFVLLLAAPGLCFVAQAQYWQQQVNYTIDVTLHDKDNSLDGFEKIEYFNNSPDTLRFIWFHLWPNAYKNDRTAYTDQALLIGDTRFYFSGRDQKGYINRLDFRSNNITCNIEDHPLYIDVIKVMLPTALSPGERVTLTTPFHEQLPFNFSRGGHDGQSYQVTQWYPKPAVYDKNGWHEMPYLEQGEYYSEFGSFDVRITLPKNYVIAATGELQDDEDGEKEKSWMLGRKNFSWQPVKERTRSKGGIVKTVVQKFPPSSPQTKTLRFVQRDIHDFAWFADKRFIVNYDTCRLISGKTINVYTYYTPQGKQTWTNSINDVKRALQFYSREVGEYPYGIVSVVQGPQSFGGGMEYPTITVISPGLPAAELDLTIAHEIGHNWFYGALGSNERENPWMDEGINTFYEQRYQRSYYKDTRSPEKIIFETYAKEKLDQPIATSSQKFSEGNYQLIAYFKTNEWLRWMEQELGQGSFDSAMRSYYSEWKFKHPQPEDFRRSVGQATGRDTDSVFSYLSKTGLLPNDQRHGTKLDFLLSRRLPRDLMSGHYQNLLTVGPAVGGNAYDGFMGGLFITNAKLPPTNFNFFLAPMCGFRSKQFDGLAKVDYAFYPNRLFRKIDVFFNASKYTDNDFTDSSGAKTFLAFEKFVPGIRFTWKPKDLRRHLERYIQWKTFFIREDGLNFSVDTVGNPPAVITRVTKTNESSYINQLLLVVNNARALYPYQGQLKLEQGKDFIRAAFTANYFFNYPKNGGLDLRFFAGKFFYTVPKTVTQEFSTERYHLNLTGPNGYEDYTFSDYFLGRNQFEGLGSQQIMVRDGGFKVRTDLLAAPVGQTDDWLIATNLTSAIPSSINPLDALPFKIPLKLFLDVGTYAEAWKKNAEGDRFLFDGGIQISAIKGILNVYVPLIYSSVFKDYIQSVLEKRNRFFRKISFSIDLSNFSPKKFDKNLPF